MSGEIKIASKGNRKDPVFLSFFGLEKYAINFDDFPGNEDENQEKNPIFGNAADIWVVCCECVSP